MEWPALHLKRDVSDHDIRHVLVHYLMDILDAAEIHVFIGHGFDSILVQDRFRLQSWMTFIKVVDESTFGIQQQQQQPTYQSFVHFPRCMARIDDHPNPTRRGYLQVPMCMSFEFCVQAPST